MQKARSTARASSGLHNLPERGEDENINCEKERAEMARELEKLLKKRSDINMAQMQRYRDGTATRARTTTANARTSQLNERIVWLREQLKSYA